MANTCSKCGKAGAQIPYGDGYVCEDCLVEVENTPMECPVCHYVARPEEAVALLLTQATATPKQRLEAEKALVNICPKCHVLYFDEVQYGFIQGLRRG